MTLNISSNWKIELRLIPGRAEDEKRGHFVREGKGKAKAISLRKLWSLSERPLEERKSSRASGSLEPWPRKKRGRWEQVGGGEEVSTCQSIRHCHSKRNSAFVERVPCAERWWWWWWWRCCSKAAVGRRMNNRLGLLNNRLGLFGREREKRERDERERESFQQELFSLKHFLRELCDLKWMRLSCL